MRGRRFFGPRVLAFALSAMIAGIAAPAYAQLGSLKGKVVDEAGKPVPDVEMTFDYAGEMTYKFTTKTDSKGEWIRAGLMSVGGRWTITAKKGTLGAVVRNVEVPLSAAATVPDIVIRPGGATGAAAAGGGPADEARARAAAEAKKVLDEVNAALTAKNYDEAITKLTEATTKVNNCVACWVRLGDVYYQKKDLTNSEQAYQKAIEMDANAADAYDGLAVLYNEQRKFDEAGKASAKAAELHGASGGGGGDATSAYNSGAILVNQGKMAEAQVQFEKAIQLNPNMAEAHYQLGMTQINQGKIADAVKSLEKYLSLAPTGPNAQMAKDMLPELKKMQ